MKYVFHPEALQEYEEAARYYAKCRVGEELRFISAIEHAIQQICDDPDGARILEDDFRRCLTRVFPYAVIYSIEDDYLLIVAVMHCHRKPGYWRNRIPISA